MNKITEAMVRNWMTTLGGVLVGLPQLVIASGFSQSPTLTHWMNLVSGLGAIFLGLASKQFNNHSTATEVAVSTAKADAALPAP